MPITPVPDAEFKIDTLHRASRKLYDDKRPQDLTDLELSHLVIYDRDAAQRALQAREHAKQAPAAPRAQQSAAARPVPLVKSVTETAIMAFSEFVHGDTSADEGAWHHWLLTHGRDHPQVSAFVLSHFTADVNNKNRARNQRLDAHDQRLASLETRLLHTRDGDEDQRRIAQLESQLAIERQDREALDLRLRALEERPPMVYREVWDAATVYSRGDTVTWDGSMWFCRKDTSRGEKPNASIGVWKLCVKRGRPGRDGDTGRPGRDEQ